MNREIKFRSFDSEKNKIIYKPEKLHKITFNDTDNGLFMGKKSKSGDWFELPIMQYIGLKDKNGVEIFIGDIVGFMYLHKITIGVVELNKYGHSCIKTKEKEYNEYHIENAIYGTIIGNIHENPELLK